MLRYIAKTFNLRLIFCKDSVDNIIEYLDLHYAGLIHRKKLTKVYVFIFAGEPIFHFSKL